MVTAFYRLAIIVSSEKTLSFYRRLGFTETFRKKREKDTVVLMDGYGIQLEFFIDPSHPVHISGPEEPIGPRRFALKVDSIEKTISELDLREENVGPVMDDWMGSRFCLIRDPDGLTIVLHEQLCGGYIKDA
ncbi:MAG: VOC family protein [Clostridia bacterium]|nr:VOC family protein [Clostridia bacterium]